jgi:hypothetical protein
MNQTSEPWSSRNPVDPGFDPLDPGYLEDQ